MKKVLLFILLSFIYASVPHEFADNKTIPADYLNDNFNYINNYISDGSSKISVKELIVSGSSINVSGNFESIDGRNLFTTSVNATLITSNIINANNATINYLEVTTMDSSPITIDSIYNITTINFSNISLNAKMTPDFLGGESAGTITFTKDTFISPSFLNPTASIWIDGKLIAVGADFLPIPRNTPFVTDGQLLTYEIF